MLVRYAVKVARTVLRGWSGSNAAPLPDHPGKLRRGRKAGRLGTSCVRFWNLVLNDGSFPFRELVLPQPYPGERQPGQPQAVGRLTLSCLLGKNKARPTKLCGPDFNGTFPECLSKIDNSLQLFFLRRKRRVTVPLLPQARRSWEVCRPIFRPLHDLLTIASFSRISELTLNC